MTLPELMAVETDRWDETHDAHLARGVRVALAAARTVVWEVPCEQRPRARFFGEVAQRLVREQADLIHTGGANWDGSSVRFNFSKWSAQAKASDRRVEKLSTSPPVVIVSSTAAA